MWNFHAGESCCLLVAWKKERVKEGGRERGRVHGIVLKFPSKAMGRNFSLLDSFFFRFWLTWLKRSQVCWQVLSPGAEMIQYSYTFMLSSEEGGTGRARSPLTSLSHTHTHTVTQSLTQPKGARIKRGWPRFGLECRRRSILMRTWKSTIAKENAMRSALHRGGRDHLKRREAPPTFKAQSGANPILTNDDGRLVWDQDRDFYFILMFFEGGGYPSTKSLDQLMAGQGPGP